MKKSNAFALLVGTVVASLPAIPAAAAEGCGNEIQVRYEGAGKGGDLLTAGLSDKDLSKPLGEFLKDHPLHNARHPTSAELRALAIYSSYHALIDTSDGGGYGVLFGPSVGGEGRKSGDEYIKFEEEDGCSKKITMMVQIPDSYNPNAGCIVAAASPGSRGIYGAIAVAEWGLKHNCAMAFTDKGTGSGIHDLDTDTINLMDGRRSSASDFRSNFTARLSQSERAESLSNIPHRFAFKHAHSGENPEKDWGKNVLRAIKYAFEKLDERFYDQRIRKEDTLVIAASLSNGGGAVLRAAEEDTEGLINAVVAWEPGAIPRIEGHPISIVQGDQSSKPLLLDHSTSIADYATLINVYQGCANLAPSNKDALSTSGETAADVERLKKRCVELHNRGLLEDATLEGQAEEAQRKINVFGIIPEQNAIQVGYWLALTPQALSVTYVNAYGRFDVGKNLCGYSYGYVDKDGVPGVLPPEVEALLFATNSGIPGKAGKFGSLPPAIGLINNDAPGGPKADQISTNDQNLNGALCLRSLTTGYGVGHHPVPLSHKQSEDSARIRNGYGAILASGDLQGIPAIIVTGRNDAILAPNFASRAYVAINNVRESAKSNLRYYEVTNAQHLDSLNVQYGGNYIPLFKYFNESMDLMFAYLKDPEHNKLPPSQVIHTQPHPALTTQVRQTNAIPSGVGDRTTITQDNKSQIVPDIKGSPSSSELITFADDTLRIPE